MPGWAYSGYYFYEILKGCANELADKHIPQVEPRQDTLGGPKGRRADTARSLSSHNNKSHSLHAQCSMI